MSAPSRQYEGSILTLHTSPTVSVSGARAAASCISATHRQMNISPGSWSATLTGLTYEAQRSPADPGQIMLHGEPDNNTISRYADMLD